MNLEVANKLYELRKKNGYSQETLAEKLGISRQSISKWERAESSPDTDNLITLAKLYGVSLDELLLNDVNKDDINNSIDDEDETSDKTIEAENSEIGEDEIPDVGHKFVNVNDGDDIVHVGTKGVYVKDADGTCVSVGPGGVFVNGEKKKPGDFTKGHLYSHKKKKNGFKVFPYPILAAIVYILLGCFVSWGWSIGWLVFLTIPLYYTFVEAIIKRNAAIFAYPVLVAGVFLGLGMFLGIWHPAWVLFLTVPLYYGIVNAIRGKEDYT